MFPAFCYKLADEKSAFAWKEKVESGWPAGQPVSQRARLVTGGIGRQAL